MLAHDAANKSGPIPADQLGAVAGKQYQGDALSVTATADGARLRCMFQRLEGQVTREGLWLTSTAEDSRGGPLLQVIRPAWSDRTFSVRGPMSQPGW